MGIISILPERIGNRNLLDNWDFRNPVNQRAASGTISTAGYFLDRWNLTSGSVTVNTGSITLNGTMTQISETAWGNNVTANVKMQSGTATISYNNTTKTTTVTSSGGVILAVKLEIGGMSTIDNDAPVDFAAELTKCQRYFYKFSGNVYSGNFGNGYYGVTAFFPVQMRAIPTIGNITVFDSNVCDSAKAGTNSTCFYRAGATYQAGYFEVTGFTASAELY